MRIIAMACLAATIAIAHPGVARAAVPDPAHSTCPQSAFLTSDGHCCFDVIVRDALNVPVGGATVEVRFNCVVQFCPAQPPGITTVGNSAFATADASGRAHFCLCGTFVPACSATILADGVALCTVPVLQDCPTPTLSSSWGLVKVLYR